MAIDNNKRTISEEELEEMLSSGKWQQVDQTINPNASRGPIGPPPAPINNQLSSGPLPPNFGYQPDLIQAGGHGPSVGAIRLFPLPPSAIPNQGSAIQSHTQPILNTANAANKTAGQAQTSATTAKTGVITINAKTAVGIVSGVLQQVPIATLGTSSLTPTQDNLNDGTTFGRVVNTALTANQIDTTKAGVLSQGGSIVGQVVGTTPAIFSISLTTTTATISWSSFSILNGDGTTTTVSSGSQLVSSLTATTAYTFYAYVVAGTTTVSFAAVSGGVGSPAIVYTAANPTAAQTLVLQQNTALSSGGVSFTTPTTGTGSGSGGGSGACCNAANTYVEHRERGTVLLADCKVGDFIRGQEGFVEIATLKLWPQKDFIRVTIHTGETVEITAAHHLTDFEGKEIKVGRLSLADILNHRGGFATIKKIELIEERDGQKVVLSCKPFSTFYAGTDEKPNILVSNVTFPSH